MKLLTRDDILKLSEGQAQTAMRHFCEAMDRGEIPDTDALEWALQAFKRIRKGAPVKKALGIGRKRGRKAPTMLQAFPRMDTALAVITRMEAGAKYEAAVEEVAKERNLSFKTVERHYSQERSYVLDLRKHMEEIRRLAATAKK